MLLEFFSKFIIAMVLFLLAVSDVLIVRDVCGDFVNFKICRLFFLGVCRVKIFMFTFEGDCGGINPYTLTAKLGLARIDGFSPPER